MAENGGMMDFISKALSDPQTVSKLQDVISMFAGPAQQQPQQQPPPQYTQYPPYPPQYNPYQAPPQSPPYQPTYQAPPAPQSGYTFPDFLQQQGFDAPRQEEPVPETAAETEPAPEPHHMTHLNSILKNLPENNPQRINLLSAIKPFLNTKRADKLDKAVQLLKNTNMANMFKGR